jgi:hypothetical protein
VPHPQIHLLMTATWKPQPFCDEPEALPFRPFTTRYPSDNWTSLSAPQQRWRHRGADDAISLTNCHHPLRKCLQPATYFSLINKKTTLSFRPEICSAQDEELPSRCLMKIYLTTLITLSSIKTRGIGKEAGKPVGWEPSTLSSCINCPSPGARLYGDFPNTDIINSIELARLV